MSSNSKEELQRQACAGASPVLRADSSGAPTAWQGGLEEHRRQKQRAALTSIFATILLALSKLAVALITGSLGIFSEALNSTVDLAGTALSYAAVRVSNRPPDATHPYGHAKFESLAALFAVVLLSLTALGILREAFLRVFGRGEVPSANWLGFAVLILSMIVDFTRSRYLNRVAEEHGSAALEADAAHFTTDLYSSATVLVALLIVAVGLGLGWPTPWLVAADAAAGALVALIILVVAARLALRAVNALTDHVPPTLVSDVVAAAGKTAETLGEPSARVRFVGDQPYADVSIAVPRGLSLERSRQVSNEVVSHVQEVLPRADVVVHTIPIAPESESAVEAVIVTAARLGLGVHHVRAFATPHGLRLDMHMEVPSTMTLLSAHQEADHLEAELRRDIAGVHDVQVHIEPRHEDVHKVAEYSREEEIKRQVNVAARGQAGRGVHDIEVLWSDEGYVVTLHCYMPADLPISVAHARTAEVEKAVRAAVPGIYRVTVHPEPALSPDEA